MADEANVPNHRYYEPRNNIKLQPNEMSKAVIKASGIAKIDARIIRTSLFSAGEQGTWYDPSDLTTLFQDFAGTTPVTAAGQPVGLMLDKSRGLALGIELVSNGDFTTNTTGWTPSSSTIASVGNELEITGSGGAFPGAYQAFSCAVGRTYSVTVTARRGTSASAAAFVIQTAAFANLTTPVQNSTTTAVTTKILFVATGATHQINLYLSGNPSSGTAYFDNISVRELAGNHATQATAAQRPTYGIHPYSGVRNVANGSASTANSTFWPTGLSNNGITATKVGSGTDTDGLPYADYSVVGTAIGLSRIFLTAMRSPAINGQTYTGSISFKLMSGTAPAATNGPFPAVIAETAPTTYVANSPFSGIPPTATETIRSVTYTLANAAINQINSSIIIDTQPAVSVNYTVRMKALQFELGSTRTAYQFNFSQYNITEAGVPSVHYIGFDGVDDGMVTSAIDFSATDAVTVFAGVRKLSDAARAMLYELGPTTATASIRLEAPNTPAVGQYVTYSNGSLSGASANTNAASAPITSVVASVSKISTDTLLLRLNGTQVASSATDQGTGNYAANQLYIGRRGGVALPFNGNIYSLIVRGAQSTAGQITNTETWVNGKTGAY